MTKFNLNDHMPAIDSMRTSLLEAPLDLEALGLSLYSLYVNLALILTYTSKEKP